MLIFLFKSILLCSAVGSVLFIVLSLIRPLTKRCFSVSWHYIIGLCVIAVMLLPIRITLPEKDMETDGFHIEYEEKNDEIKHENAVSGAPAIGSSLPVLNEKLTYASAYVWGIITVLLILRREVMYIAFINKLRRSTVPCVISAPQKIKHIRKGRCISSPIVTGIISQTLYLPDIPLSQAEMTVIFSHETIHLRRKDLFAKRIIGFTRCVHFFNPFVYMLEKTIDLDCEISCDLAATRKMSKNEKNSYMLSLLSLVSRCSRMNNSFAVNIFSGKETLKRRFTGINTGEEISKKAKILSAVVALVILTSSLCVSGVLASEIKKPEEDIPETLSEDMTVQEHTDEVVTVPQTVDDVQNKTAKSVLKDTEKLIFPCDAKNISSHFEKKHGVFHNGVDIRADTGSAVYACTDARVILVGEDKNSCEGITVRLMTADSVTLIYEHLESVLVKDGDSVKAGDVIAKSGATGLVTGPCLHFSVVKDGEYVNPEAFLGYTD